MAAQSTADAATSVAPDRQNETKDKARHAPLYRVLIHNDDVTTMEFVLHILRTIFQKSNEDSIKIMLRAHHTGIAHVTTLPLEQAEFRVDQSHSLARAQKFPLKLTYERED
jgi:ATP-dependent Clp protease adaptor protein ClpS